MPTHNMSNMLAPIGRDDQLSVLAQLTASSKELSGGIWACERCGHYLSSGVQWQGSESIQSLGRNSMTSAKARKLMSMFPGFDSLDPIQHLTRGVGTNRALVHDATLRIWS